MASTVSYSASLCTRHYNSSSNAKNGYASQEFYDSSYNNVGIISFPCQQGDHQYLAGY